MGNAKDRKKARTEKELLALGRDAKQVRQNALTMEEQVRQNYVTIGELRSQLSQMELDRNAWRAEAVRSAGSLETSTASLQEHGVDLILTRQQLAAALKSVDEHRARVAELEEGLVEMPKLRRRLQERAVEVADRDKEIAQLRALLKRHERVSAMETALAAGAKAGI